MKKRFFAGVAVLSLVFGLTGCGKSSDNSISTAEINIPNQNVTVGEDTEYDSALDDPAVKRKVDQINSYIDTYFYFDYDEDNEEEAIYDAMMSNLNDPYSVYYTKEEYEDITEETSGEYVGVGAVVTQDENKTLRIVRTIPGSPAEEAGLMPDDVLVQVDDMKITDQDISIVVDKIRGVEGTTAHIKIYRASAGRYITFDMVRRVVENMTVSYEMLDGNIGYIQVTQFYENTFSEFKTAYDELVKDGATSLVVDLRDNPGGMVTAVVDMCDYLMKGGVIVTTKDKNGKVTSEYKATSKHFTELPMVVLINGNSASASEIFSGAMKDTEMATLIGTTTYGKGIVQAVIPLGDGSAIKLTVSKYFTPDGNDIHEVGIEPDVTVELPDGRMTSIGLSRDEDIQLQAAIKILSGEITVEEAKEMYKNTEEDATSDDSAEDSEETTEETTEE